MGLVRKIVGGVKALLGKRRLERELDEELRNYLEAAAAEKMTRGMSGEEAVRAARVEMGSLEGTKEIVRSAGWESFVETLWQDLRFALRRLRMAPTFTIATILTLALGIGATTSIFTLVHAVLLKSLPVANPGELYRLGKESRCCFEGGYSQEKEFSLVSYDLYKYLRDHTKGFSELARSRRSSPCLASDARTAPRQPKAI